MKIVTWNVNSLKSRLEHVKDYLQQQSPDFLLLQEIKGLNEEIFEEFIQFGYKSFYSLQKTYNGVAIITKHQDCILVSDFLPTFPEDEQKRFISIKYKNINIINIYLPNGNPLGTEKYTYKKLWLNHLRIYLDNLIKNKQDFLIAGDFNIAPQDIDVYSTKSFQNDAITQKEIRDTYFNIINLGLTDIIDYKYHNQNNIFTWWDYRNNSFAKDNGMRIDHILVTPNLVDKYQDCYIDKNPRILEQPSDHTPVVCILGDS